MVRLILQGGVVSKGQEEEVILPIAGTYARNIPVGDTFSVKKGGQHYKVLARHWEITPDGTTVTVHISDVTPPEG